MERSEKRRNLFAVAAFCAALAAGFAVPAPAGALMPPGPGDPDGHEDPRATDITATEARSSIRIDGVIEPREWAGAPVISDFTARNPIEGAAPSQRTEVRLLYSRSHLYIAFSNYDTEPEQIVARVSTRDNWRLSTDKVQIDIDPYHDRRNAYHFIVGAANVQVDSYGMDINWDGVWESATRITDEGWFAEIAIPFSILRFEARDSQTMGINFSRDIQRTKEDLAWRAWRRNDRSRIDKYGNLLDLRGLRASHNLEIMPYAKASGQRFYDPTDTDPTAYDGTGVQDMGVDIKYGLTSNLALDVTLNPDFGQIAPDQEQINVTRYERYRRELRPFFQEGQGIFRTPMQIFYSRRIGKQVFNGPEVNLLAGAKITGRTGRYEIGVINAFTEKKDYVNSLGNPTSVPMANYAVVRVKRDIFTRSSVGFLVASKEVNSGGGGRPWQRSAGIDLNLRWGQNYSLTAFLGRSINPGEEGNDWASQVKFNKRTDLWDYGTELNYLGPQFDVNDVGFITQVDRRRIGANVGWKPRPEKHGVRRIELKGSFQASRNFAGLYTHGRYAAEMKVQGMNYMEFEAKANMSDTRWRNVDDPLSYSVVDRFYRGNSYDLSFNTDRTKDYSFNISTGWGNFIDFGDRYWGRSWTTRSGFAFRPNPRLSASLSLTHIREYLGTGVLDEAKNLLVTRVSYYFTPNLSVRVYNQFRLFLDAKEEVDRQSYNSLNLVFSYFLNAKSVFYLVFNEIRNDGIGDDYAYYREFGRLPLSDRAALAKLTYWFNF